MPANAKDATADTVAGARRRVLRGLAATLGAALSTVGVVAGGGGPAARVHGPGATPVPVGASGTVLTVVAFDATGTLRLSRQFDLAALAALAPRTLVATAPWYGQAHRFTGPLLRDVLAAAGVSGAAGATVERLTAVALNDYRVEVPLGDVERWPVIVALRVDDRPVAVRDKGPLMIMYPFDDDPSLRRARYHGRAVWQLHRLELR